MILDIGCGFRPRGDINLDISTNSKANLIADVHYLPFSDGVFEKVLAIHILEHSSKPLKIIKEMLRVGKQIVIKCPHRFSSVAKSNGHKSSFNRKWFVEACHYLTIFDYSIDTRVEFFPFIRPHELIVRLRNP